MNITVSFEEMPAVILDGCDSGLLDGTIEVEYDRERCWTIEAISIEVYRPSHYIKQPYSMTLGEFVPSRRELHPLSTTDNAPLYGHLREVIEDRLSDYIARQIERDIEERKEAAAEARAEARREELMLERM